MDKKVNRVTRNSVKNLEETEEKAQIFRGNTLPRSPLHRDITNLLDSQIELSTTASASLSITTFTTTSWSKNIFSSVTPTLSTITSPIAELSEITSTIVTSPAQAISITPNITSQTETTPSTSTPIVTLPTSASSSAQLPNNNQQNNMANQEVQYLKPRDVVHTIPIFTGDNSGCSFREFRTACEDAKFCVADTAESSFTQLLKTRLSGNALKFTQGTRFVTTREFLDHLKGIYAPRESSLVLRGELGRLHQFYEEDVPSYLSRTRSLGNNTIDAFKNEHNGVITEQQKRELENEVSQAFILGLRNEISIQMGEHNNITNAGLEAVKIESKLRSQAKLRLTENPIQTSIKEVVKNTPTRQVATKEVTRTCNYCKRPGHLYDDCRRRTATCSNCSKKGHFAAECKMKKVHFIQKPRNDQQCQFCQQTGHTAKNCFKVKANTTNKVCQFCEKSGHIATECFKINPDLSKKLPTCTHCNILGHTYDKCRRRQTEMQSGNGQTLPRNNLGEGTSNQ